MIVHQENETNGTNQTSQMNTTNPTNRKTQIPRCTLDPDPSTLGAKSHPLPLPLGPLPLPNKPKYQVASLTPIYTIYNLYTCGLSFGSGWTLLTQWALRRHGLQERIELLGEAHSLGELPDGSDRLRVGLANPPDLPGIEQIRWSAGIQLEQE